MEQPTPSLAVSDFLEGHRDELERLVGMIYRMGIVWSAHEFFKHRPYVFEAVVGQYVRQTQRYAYDIACWILEHWDGAGELMDGVEAQIREVFMDENIIDLFKMGLFMNVVQFLAESGRAGVMLNDDVDSRGIELESVNRVLGPPVGGNAQIMQEVLNSRLRELDPGQDFDAPGRFALGLYHRAGALAEFWKGVISDMVFLKQ